MPEGPAVAGRKSLQRGADLVDRAFVVAGMVAGDKVAIGADACAVASGVIEQDSAGLQKSLFDHLSERNAGFLTLLDGFQEFFLASLDAGDTVFRVSDIVFFTLDADKVAAQFLRNRTRRAGAEEG